ncbi:hypothetical protein G6F17_014370 [Rhizopus arrhizus]|nr:hypothetical protein G6F17_014370 [Rhizopus arrhizus]
MLESAQERGVELARHVRENAEGRAGLERRLVAATLDQRAVHGADRHHPHEVRYLAAAQSVRVAGAVEIFMV